MKRLQNAKTRQITVEERQEITEVVEENDLPAIDLEVFFISIQPRSRLRPCPS